MLLYELALELGVRSTALLDRAHALGFHVDQTTPLTPEQVEALRSAYGKGRGAQQQAGEPAAAAVGAPEASQQMGAPAILAIVGAVLVVVLLGAYMISNSGGSDTVRAGAASGAEEAAAAGSDEVTTTTEPCDSSASGVGIGAIGQGDDTTTTAAEPEGDDQGDEGGSGTLPPCSVVGGLSGDEISGPSTTDVSDPLDAPRDKREFCRAAIAVVEFEGKMFDAADPTQIGPLRETMLQGRDKWKTDVAAMESSAPPRLDASVERYRIVYTNLLDSVTPQSDEYQLADAFIRASRTDLRYYTSQIFEAINLHCDK